ncbi:hypothetical protein HNR00_003409 [Methylorubrum rhodinum]|uniref:Uncharacterized protein n=1 Tax=Methylorubrum rhodinum TaxID=29428 RepID=A0A840ZM59_9HYPH|nr:hypothetical protein [Methylorubrum rhodinum]MBB5758686.1 hypothetical protein [Methylorubrum rhodinum]
MNPAFTGSRGTVAAINGHFLLAFACGASAWLVWPQTPEWWGFGVLSIVLDVAAVSSLVKAVRAIVRLHARERAVAEFQALGPPPKSSQMASRAALVRMGMIDDDA